MKLYINTDINKKEALKTEENLKEILENLNVSLTRNIEDSDIITSIGGDGTFLDSARISDGTPILGINCGTLGYLTDIKPEDIKKALDDILNKKYFIEERMMLEGEIVKDNGETIKIPQALNEIAISKNTFGVLRFDAIVDSKLINSYTADGILVCTPTGSTAYNLSCGGPIVDPEAEIITLTPIAPHTILNRSIVLSNTSEVEICINELRGDTSSFVLYDGHPIEIKEKDTVFIRKSEHKTRILNLEWQSFIDIIRNTIR